MKPAHSALLMGFVASVAACQTMDTGPPRKVIETIERPAPGTTRSPASETGWTLVWADEFDAAEIDRTKWDFDIDCWGGGNDERQCYTDRPENARIEDGRLIITALKERYTGPAFPPHMRTTPAAIQAKATKPFTSARMVTRGKAAWQYGRVEVRARLPQGQGTWPAIWMLPEENAYGTWAASGEIDILEAVNLGIACKKCPGGRESTILGTLHFGGLWPDNALNSTEMAAPDVLEGFHTFGIIWAPDVIEWTYDGQVFARKKADTWWSVNASDPLAPFDRPFHLILNLAIGGGLAEERGAGGVDESGFPKTLEIDWVRVWQCQPDNAQPVDCKRDS
jgi:beta-glucanase (GH16 family)